MVPLRRLPIVVRQAVSGQSRSRVVWMGHQQGSCCLPGAHDNVVSQKNFQPPGLSSGEYVGCLEVFEVLVVVPNSNLVNGALEVMTPRCKYFDDGQLLPIRSVIMLFCWKPLLQLEIDWPEFPERIVLVETARNRESNCIHLEEDWFGRIKMLEDRCLGEGPFQFPERQLGFLSLFPSGRAFRVLAAICL